ncbi:hypothetical protein SAMN04488137_0838 [Fictibacillus solisalsi]|uniref:Uncharacterized protein n=1 Tax=Fictibacillus solisalsi TaxID=459525 RepID=A0A1G9UC05_9BACL|nr:hypothetical protein [Fictibacillus solisalsi]SDM57507.1 hypothetical protein SAMN04488137_0838 [Fictibacillus solisalsi]
MLNSWLFHLLAFLAIICFLGFYFIPGANFGFYFISFVSGLLLMILCYNEVRKDYDECAKFVKKEKGNGEI